MANEIAKQAAANKALTLIKSGMTIGIGTGSTAAIFIPLLLEKIEKESLSICCISTSTRSTELLKEKVPLINDSLDLEIDITFDGADRVDTKHFHLIKGGGGALLREKLVAYRSKKNVVLVDETKISSPLSGFPLAVELVPFGYKSTIERLRLLGYEGLLRIGPDKNPVFSDNQNLIYDISFKGPILDPIQHEKTIKNVLGVIESGLFLNTASVIYIGKSDGTVQIMEKS
jgi:ribose 5-phosphate isomerase A